MWGTVRLNVIESAHLFTCKRLLSVSEKKPKSYGIRRYRKIPYPLYLGSTIYALKYWLKVGKMPMNRFPKQAYLIMKNRIDVQFYVQKQELG